VRRGSRLPIAAQIKKYYDYSYSNDRTMVIEQTLTCTCVNAECCGVVNPPADCWPSGDIDWKVLLLAPVAPAMAVRFSIHGSGTVSNGCDASRPIVVVRLEAAL
jgi:hypothetical protein